MSLTWGKQLKISVSLILVAHCSALLCQGWARGQALGVGFLLPDFGQTAVCSRGDSSGCQPRHCCGCSGGTDPFCHMSTGAQPCQNTSSPPGQAPGQGEDKEKEGHNSSLLSLSPCWSPKGQCHHTWWLEGARGCPEVPRHRDVPCGTAADPCQGARAGGRAAALLSITQLREPGSCASGCA